MIVISLLSHVYLAQYGQNFPHFSCFVVIKSTKEKLGKYCSHCTLNRARLMHILKINKIDFCVTCFRSDFVQFCSATVKVFILCGRLGTCP